MVQKFQTWLILSGLCILIIVLAFPSTVRAGGWAVVTLDELPKNIQVGQPYSLRFMVRQHGRTPLIVGKIYIHAAHLETGEKLIFSALPDDRPGRYKVELLFPKAGAWEWGAATSLYPEVQPLPDLVVGSGTETTAIADRASGSSTITYSILSLLGLAAIAVLIVRRPPGRKAALIAGLMLFFGGLAFVLLSSASAERGKIQSENSIATTGQSALGQQLFLAKGCVVCHINDRAFEQSETVSVNVGPNLTKYSNDPAYLRSFLASPKSVRETSEMPNLALSADEIEALVEFLSQGNAE